MNSQATIIWETLEFRTPVLLETVDRLSETQMRWQPPNGANSAAWLLWHIAEVEDNWVRDKVYGQGRRFPLGNSVRDTSVVDYPSKADLLGYFHEVRTLSRERLGQMSDDDLARRIEDETFGTIDVRRVWLGVATSCAWHGGQLVLLAKRIIP